MNIKAILYLLVVPLVVWAFDSVDINKIFKKNRNLQARITYLCLLIAVTYLVVNFFYDFFIVTT